MPAHPELSGPWPTVERLSSADYPSDGPPGAMLNLARAANREDRRELRDRALAASARRLLELSPGQVLPLGRRTGDRVELRAGGKVIGDGELIDVDGELAVRVVRLAP